MRRIAPLLVLLASGCKQPTDQALSVIVTLAPGTQSQGVKVVATSGLLSQETAPIVVDGRTELRVAIVNATDAGTVTVQAVGYRDQQCEQLTVPGERSEAVTQLRNRRPPRAGEAEARGRRRYGWWRRRRPGRVRRDRRL